MHSYSLSVGKYSACGILIENKLQINLDVFIEI